MQHHNPAAPAARHSDKPPFVAYQADAALLADIRETNVSYLVLAQRMLRSDCAASMRALGIDEKTAEWMLALSEQGLFRLASSSSLLCRLPHEAASIGAAIWPPGHGRKIPAG